MNQENIKKIYDPIEVDDDYFIAHEDQQEMLYQKIKELPDGITNILFGIDTPDILEEISLSYGLTSIQSASLSRLIRKILVGETYIGDFPTEISSDLELEQSKARELAGTIAAQLFQSEIEDIKKVQAVKFPGRLPAKPIIPNIPPTTAPQQKYQGEDLPESGGNIIDLRQK